MVTWSTDPVLRTAEEWVLENCVRVTRERVALLERVAEDRGGLTSDVAEALAERAAMLAESLGGVAPLAAPERRPLTVARGSAPER